MVRAVLGFAALASTGCRGWARVEGAGAFNTAGHPGHDGALVGVDGVIGLRGIKWIGEEGFPIGVHTSLEGTVAPNLKSFGWGTGVALFYRPRPVAPYAIVGTLLHVDSIDGRFSFGGGSPYGEIGLITPVGRHDDDAHDGTVVTLGIGFTSHLNYLAPAYERVEGFALLKLGIGYEKN